MIYSNDYKIGIEDIGINSEATNKALLAIMQDVSALHSASIGYGVLEIETKKRAWMLLDWKMKVIKRPKYNYEIKAETWSRKVERLYAYRDFQLKDKDGNTKRLLDKIGDYERGGKSLEDADNERLWAEIDNKLRKKFDDRTLEIFYSWFGLFGYEKLSGKEMMAKYGFRNPSNINANNYKVMNYMKSSPEMMDALRELYEFTTERQHDDDTEDRDYEPVRIPGMRFNDDDEVNE